MPPFPPPPPPQKKKKIGGKNHIWKDFPDLACGAIFWMIVCKQQFLHSNWLKTCQLIPNQWNFTSATLNHIRFVFYPNIKDNERNLCQDLLKIENTDSDLKVHALHYANELLVRVRLSFQKLLQNRSTYRNNTTQMFGIRPYSLSIGVQTTINHVSIFTFLCFLRQYQRQRKCFLSERELKKALRDTLTRAEGLGPLPSNFLLVRSEHAHANYPGLECLDSSFARPGSAPIWGGKKAEFRDWTRSTPRELNRTLRYSENNAPPTSYEVLLWH